MYLFLDVLDTCYFLVLHALFNCWELNVFNCSLFCQAVTKAKLGYDPLEVNPEDMVRFAKERPQVYDTENGVLLKRFG